MSDVDVRIGMQVAGDASGAQKVDEAVRKVGDTAKEVAQETAEAAQQSGEQAAAAAQKAAEAAGQAAEKVGDVANELGESGKAAGGIDELNGAVDGLKDALGGLSPEKSKNLVNGLTQALLGLGSGDIGTGLAGVGKSLFNLASLIPLPGAATALGASVGLIAAFYKLLGNSTDEPTRKLNDLGETVEQEMDRLAAWAQSQFEWDGIKNANAGARADFDLLKTSAETALAAVQNLFSAQSSARVSALQREAASAEASGDPARAAQLKQQVEDEKAKAELVNLHLAMTQAKAEAAEQTALLKTQSENNARLEKEAAQSSEKLSQLQDQIRSIAGNLDAIADKGAMDSLLAELNEKLGIIAGQRSAISAQGGVSGGQGYFESAARLESLSAQQAELEAFILSIRNYTEIANQAKEAEKEASDARAKSNEEAIKAATSLTELGLKIEALKEQIKSVESSVTPEISEAAKQQAGYMAGAVGDFLESTLSLATDDVQGILDAKKAAVDALSASAGNLETAKASYEKQVSLAEIPPVMEEAAGKIGEGNKAIREAVEGTGNETLAAADAAKTGAEEIRRSAEDFRVTLVSAATGYKASALEFDKTAKTLSRTMEEVSRGQESLSLEVAAMQANVSRALADAAAARRDAQLAQSWITNQ